MLPSHAHVLVLLAQVLKHAALRFWPPLPYSVGEQCFVCGAVKTKNQYHTSLSISIFFFRSQFP